MKKFLSALVALLVVSTVWAQNPHINKKDQGDVLITASPVEVCFSGVVAGNGNASSVTAFLIVNVAADTYCYNPAGGAKDPGGVPGHQDFTVRGEEKTFDCRNGKANLQGVCAPLDIAVDCPNSKWNGVIENLQIISIVLVINGKELDVTQYYY